MKRLVWLALGAAALWALQATDTLAVPKGSCGCDGSSSGGGSGGSYFGDPVIV